ncbi:hypothetical protein QJQ45_027803 [Haematococcus lacustris]|nr:hypothetical protein QJQ45_027803 [Haematococcus lacustris]
MSLACLQIAATHALGDVWAMGGQPRSALALAVVPLMAESKVEEELVAMMAGALQVLNDAGCSLVGGHTSEGSDLSLGFSVTGEVSEQSVMRKGGLAPGQVLLLTKALGTGTIMAASMQAKAKGAWVASALASMTTSSAAAATILSAHSCKAATDVTGFGLVGHLVEMTRASGVAVSLQWDALPLLPGAADCLEQGLTSSLHTANAKAAAAIANFDAVLAAWPTAWRILVDPQTAGGLLAALPPDTAVAAQQALREAGYVHTAIIGKVEPATALVPPVTIILPQAHTAQPPPAPP